MSDFVYVVFTFYIWFHFNNNSRKKVTLFTIKDAISENGHLGEVQSRLNEYLAEVRDMNIHIVNSDIKGEARVMFYNKD